MAKKFLVDLDLNHNQLVNAVIQAGTAEPAGAVEGQLFYRTDTDKLEVYDGSNWIVLQDNASALLSDLNDVTITSASDAQVLIYDATDSVWKNQSVGGDVTIDKTGVVTIADGVVTFTKIDSNAISTDIATDPSDQKVARADAVKNYVDNAIATADAFKLKGEIDASTNPNYPAADAGDAYVISAAGKVGGDNGTPVEVGDMIICKQDGTASGDEATVGDKWIKIQRNTDYATTDVMGLVKLATQAETEAKTDNQKVVTPADLVNFPRQFTTTIGNGTDTSITVAHNLNNKYVNVNVYDEGSGDEVECDVTLVDANNTKFTFSTAPAENSIRVVIAG